MNIVTQFQVPSFGIDGVVNIWRKRISDSISDEGVCRTAPATPGLLIIWASVKCSDTDAGHLGHYRQWRKLDYICEHMASVGSLDVVNLPTISANMGTF